MNAWIFKTEPTTFSLNDLKNAKDQITFWDGVRNFQARNRLRDEVKVGDQVFIYHSSCAEPGIAGLASVTVSGQADLTALDPEDHHYDPKSTLTTPIWYGVKIQFVKSFAHFINIGQLRKMHELANMEVLRKGNRLSITKVSKSEAQCILRLSETG